MATDVLAINEIMIRISKRAKLLEKEKNRRTDKRYPVHASVQCGHLNPITGEFEKDTEGWVGNMSHTGLLLLVEKSLESGMMFDIDLEGLGVPGQFVTCLVRRNRQLLANTYEVGVSFLMD